MSWYTFKPSGYAGEEINNFFKDVFDSLTNDYKTPVNYDDAYGKYHEAFDFEVERQLAYYSDQDNFIKKAGFSKLWAAFVSSDYTEVDRNTIDLHFFYAALEQINAEEGILTVNDEEDFDDEE